MLDVFAALGPAGKRLPIYYEATPFVRQGEFQVVPEDDHLQSPDAVLMNPADTKAFIEAAKRAGIEVRNSYDYVPGMPMQSLKDWIAE